MVIETVGWSDYLEIVGVGHFHVAEGIASVTMKVAGSQVTGNARAKAYKGSSRDDVFGGGGVRDIIAGGGGHDGFIFSAANREAIDICDFPTQGVNADVFVLDGAAFGLVPGALAAGAYAYLSGGEILTTDTRLYVVDTGVTSGELYYDSDGSRPGGAVFLASFNYADTFAITSGNFFVI